MCLAVAVAQAGGAPITVVDTSKVFGRAKQYLMVVEGHMAKDRLDSAMRWSFVLRDILEPYPEHPLYMKATLQYAEILRNSGRQRDAVRAMIQGVRVATHKEPLAQAYNQMAGLYYELGYSDSAYYFVDLSIKNTVRGKSNLTFRNVWMLGALDRSTGRYTEAIRHLQEALRTMPAEELANRNVILNHLGQCYLALGKKKEALDTLQYAYEDSKQNGTVSQQAFVARVYFVAAAKLDAFEETLFMQVLGYQDTLHKYQQASNIALLETREELSAQREKNVALTLKANAQAEQQRLLVFGGIGVLFISGLLFGFYLTARRQKEKIEDQNVILSAQQEELKSKQEDLEQLNASKDALLSVVSHDVRGPLITLGATLQLLAQGHLSDEETKVVLQGLAERVRDTETLLNDVLLWTKGNMLGLLAEDVLLNPVDIMEEVLVQSRPLLQTNHVEVEVLGTPVPFYGDPGLIKVVFRNILANAIRHGAKPGVVTIHYVSNETEAGFCVKDKGKGMPQELVERLMASRVEVGLPNRSMLSLGGLGLVLVKDFTHRQKGRLDVTSSKEGTCLKVWMRR